MSIPLLASPRRRSVAISLATALLVIPMTVLASHRFADVGDDHIFHDDISAMADAGITLGCGGGNYCPDIAVDRGQMAAFLNRGLPRAALGGETRDLGPGVNFFLGDVTMTTGGAAGGTGFVVVDADVTAQPTSSIGSTCPCEVRIWIDHFDGEVFIGPLVESSSVIAFTISGEPSSTGVVNGAGSVSWVFEVPTAETQSFAVNMSFEDSGSLDASPVTFESIITAIYVPYGTRD